MPLSSRERLLAVLRYQEPDYVPLLFNTFGFTPPAHLRWSNQVERAQRWQSIGVDAWLSTTVPMQTIPTDVATREWQEKGPGDRWPCTVKEYHTRAGVFRQEVYRTDDWETPDWPSHPSGSGLSLLDDYNVPRYRRCPIETEADLEKLRHLLSPRDEAIARFRQDAETLARQADKLGVLLVGYGIAGADAAFWLCGSQATVLMAMDRPAMFEQLLSIIHEWDKRNLEILLDTPVELVQLRGYYEGTTFWSPSLYRRFFMPRIKKLTEMVHQAGRRIMYTMSVGCMPLLDTLAEIGYDAHYLLDPIPAGTRIDLQKVKSAFRGKTAVIGALNSPITLERGTPEAIRREVHDAVRILGPGGGLALSPAEAIYANTPWRNLEILMNAWKEVR